MTYNGYENYETYTVAVWLDQNGIDYNVARVELANLQAQQLPPDQLRVKMARFIHDRLDDAADNIRRLYSRQEYAYQQMIVDLLNASLERVNYYEVASSIMGASE